MAKNELTQREKAAIRLYVFTEGDIGLADLYAVAYDGDKAAVARIKSIPSVASRWWRSQKVIEYYTEQRAAFEARRQAERQRIERELSARLNATAKREIDYSDPRNQMRKINEIINASTDPAETLDALKLAISKQNELAPFKKSEQIQRFYTPVQCRNCAIKQAFGKIRTEHPEIFKSSKASKL